MLDGYRTTGAFPSLRDGGRQRRIELHRVGFQVDDDDAAIAPGAELLKQRGQAERSLSRAAVAQEMCVLAEQLPRHQQRTAIVSITAHVQAVAFNRVERFAHLVDQIAPIVRGYVIGRR